MSQTRIVVKKATAPPNRMLRVALIVAVVFLIALYLFGVYWPGFPTNRRVAEAKIVDTRVVVADMRETQYGTKAYYRIEARVNYSLEGRMQDRWIPVSEPYTDKALLERRLATHPVSCEVSWPESNPGNALCRLNNGN